MFIIYDILFFLFAIIYLPLLIFKQKWHRLFKIRFGIFPLDIKKALGQKPNIWIHAVSVGEVLTIGRLVTELKQEFPWHRLVISTVTQTGYNLALSKAAADDIVIYAPLDFSFIVKKFIQLIQPKIYIVAETEIWPNLFLKLAQSHIPIILINGRISDSAFSRYRFIRFLTKNVLSVVNIFCMQSSLDAERIIQMGALQDKVKMVGNMKFDDILNAGALKRESLGYGSQDILLIGGSTHPGEEEILLEIYRSLSKDYLKLRLLIAPRHIDRTEEISSLIEKSEFKPVRLSQKGQQLLDSKDVLIVDTIGQLKSFYGLSDLVFVGKSLTKKGGHNIIEPAFFAKPILIGPHMENFRDITDLFLREQAVLQVKDQKELVQQIKFLLDHPSRCKALGALAKNVVEKYRGATQKTLEMIAGLLR